jgi:uncharacterized protein
MATLREFARACDYACAEESDGLIDLGITPLHKAAYEGDTKSAQALITKGADVNSQDTYGWTPLHDAALQGNVAIVDLLLKEGAQVNVQDKEDFYTPLHDAVEEQHLEVIERLIKAGASTTLKNKAGLTPLELAVSTEKNEASALLKRLTQK